MWRGLIPLLITASLGCAQLVHSPVTSFEEPNGIPYYGGSYYLLVHTDGLGNLVPQLLWLPDPSKKRVAKPMSIFASLQSKLTFTKGVLTGSQEKADTTAVPKAIIAAAVKVASSILALRAKDDVKKLPAPSIYKLVVKDATTIKFIGKDSDYTVSVTVTEN